MGLSEEEAAQLKQFREALTQIETAEAEIKNMMKEFSQADPLYHNLPEFYLYEKSNTMLKVKLTELIKLLEEKEAGDG